jgi:damage-control phosphatase, subfamily III
MTVVALFRRISTSFSLSQHWKSHDVFARQKLRTFRSSRPAVLELAGRYRDLVAQLEARKGQARDEEAEKLLFMEMCEICLWGNATDLSLLTDLSYEDIQKLQGSAARKAAEKNILVNDLPKAYDVLNKARHQGKAERRVDIVLDNAGFELFVDLILAGYLLSSGLATIVVLHPKSIPWFVSDVLPSDFAALLNALASPKRFYETPSEEEEHQQQKPVPLSESDEGQLAFLFQQWSGLYANGHVILRPNRFWTHPGSYWRLPQDKDLFEDLKTSELVIFKGDLNYRKLTGDVSAGSFPLTEA